MKRRANAKSKIVDLQSTEKTKHLDTTGIFFEARPKSAGNSNVGSVLQRYLNSRAKERLSPTILQTPSIYPPKSPTKGVSEKAIDDSCDSVTKVITSEATSSPEITLQVNEQENDISKDMERDFKSINNNSTTQLKSHLSDSDLPNASDPVVTLTTGISEADPMEHLTPHPIDTSEVAGKILQVIHKVLLCFL